MAAAAAVALVGLVIVGSQQGAGQDSLTRAGSIEELVTLRPDGSVLVAQPGVERPLVEVYEDYQCPYCEEFEQGNGMVARRAALRGELALLIHPMTIFADSPMRENSRRALLASLCVRDPERWLAYHDALYAAQPSETKDGGFAVPDLVALAGRIGVSTADFTACVGSRDTAAKADGMSMTARAEGVEGTPTVRYDGRDIDWRSPWGEPGRTVDTTV